MQVFSKLYFYHKYDAICFSLKLWLLDSSEYNRCMPVPHRDHNLSKVQKPSSSRLTLPMHKPEFTSPANKELSRHQFQTCINTPTWSCAAQLSQFVQHSTTTCYHIRLDKSQRETQVCILKCLPDCRGNLEHVVPQLQLYHVKVTWVMKRCLPILLRKKSHYCFSSIFLFLRMRYKLQNILAQQCTQNTSNCSNTQCRHGVWPNKAKPGAHSSSSTICLQEESHSPPIPPNQAMFRVPVSIDPFFSSTWENLFHEKQSPWATDARAVARPLPLLPWCSGHSRLVCLVLVCPAIQSIRTKTPWGTMSRCEGGMVPGGIW